MRQGGVMKYNLDSIVPDLEARCKKLNTLRKVFMGLTLLIIPAIPAMIILGKYGECMQLCRIMNNVKMHDKVPITNVFGYAVNAREAAQKMIDTGNLAGYRIVGGAMIVKDGVEMTDEQAQREAAKYFSVPAAVASGMTAESMGEVGRIAVAEQEKLMSASVDVQMRFCPKCGGKLNGGEEFCPGCGAKLQENQKQ